MKLSRDEYERLKREKPHLFVDRVDPQKPEPPARPALVQNPSKRRSRAPRIVVSLVQFRRRLLDQHDNQAASCKPLVDALATAFGVEDKHPAISWQYAQIQTRGRTGVLVTIEIV